MTKDIWKPGTMVYPLPAVMVTCGEYRKGGTTENSNIITLSWVGTVCTDPAMVSISIRPERYSHAIIEKSGEFVINLTTRGLAFATDYCGMRSGRNEDKFQKMKLTPLEARTVSAPLIKESPVNIECKVTEIKKLGSHDMFLAEVICIHADRNFIDKKGVFDMEEADLICYSHGKYFAMGKYLGHFGFSVGKKKRLKDK
ncbi:MAG: flavin reductase family protein [Candidatus Saganbacteria bacterium]|nr:flavin reductase family protein [Candidatus Saganbacteria bacterium]